MHSWLDFSLVMAALLGAIVYLLYHTWRKRGSGACCDSGGRNNPNRIQIKIPKQQ
jgi:hypothetical protein